ncbi:MAG: hypothetical protein GY851_17620, partial [bacterium]|nr:hypothetical protein [bacterium]
TYITYQGPHEDPYVCAYDHAAEKWSGPVKAGVNLMGKTPDPTGHNDADDHGRPALIVDMQGYIHVVFGGHGGFPKFGRNELGAWGKGKQTHVVSKNPRDLSEWKELENISPFGTYSQFVKMDNGDIYLFYRHGSHRSNWVYQKSTDNCRTFAPPVSVLKHKTREEDPNIHDAWYAWFENGLADTVTASYIYHPCAVRGHTKERYNAYYMQMDCTDDSWQTVRGQALTLPVTKEQADVLTLVCNTGGERSNHGTCRMDSEGNPHVFFRQGPGQVRYFRWMGDSWFGPVAVTGQHKSQDGDFVVESSERVRMLLSNSTPEQGEVRWWETSDGGRTWEKGASLVSSPQTSYRVSTLVRNGHPDGRMVVTENRRGQDHPYKRMLLIGDNGPVQRPEAETKHLGDRLDRLRQNAQ